MFFLRYVVILQQIINMSFDLTAYTEITDFILKNTVKSVKIVAISKNHPLNSIEVALSAGVRIFGENRVQEALEKFRALKAKYNDIELHLTGPLQSNKVKQALDIFDVFQTLDREKLVRELVKFPEKIHNKQFFIQINIGKENNKRGVMPEDSNDFINYCRHEQNLNISGLMCMPPQYENPKSYFLLLKSIAQNNNINCLSMGMSSDFKSGIICGATHVRVGTYIFGSRS